MEISKGTWQIVYISMDYVKARASEWNSFKLQRCISLLTLSFSKPRGVFAREDKLVIYQYLAKESLQIGNTTPEGNLIRLQIQVDRNVLMPERLFLD